MAAFQLRVMKDVEVGFYGKLPSHGDFLRRRAPDAFVTRWDAWLQEGMAASRHSLGDRWLDVYLTSPAWRFVCAAGACGPSPVVGLLVPSIDRVGRYFPMTVVAEVPSDLPIVAVASRTASFFEAAEQLLVETLAAEEVNFERFDAQVAGLGRQLGALVLPEEVRLDPMAAAVLRGGPGGWHVPIDSTGQLGPVFEQLLAWQMAQAFDPLVLWWTDGSSMVEPSCLVNAGLPSPSTFGAFLNGDWAEHRWRAAPAQVNRPELPSATALDVPVALRLRSAAGTDVGRVRSVNQDAFVERPDIGVWAVADGLGGHRDGEVASREVCDALSDIAPPPSFDDLVDVARDRILQVNDHLFRRSAQSVLTDRCASTVVALLVRGARCAVLWAGDSRVYRWRAGVLELLTHDHSVEEANPLTGRQEAHGITRAIGVAASLTLDERREELRAGDRFLLCSDGLTRIVSDAEVQERMAAADLQVVVSGLIGLALDGGGPDNVTALMVEVYA